MLRDAIDLFLLVFMCLYGWRNGAKDVNNNNENKFRSEFFFPENAYLLTKKDEDITLQRTVKATFRNGKLKSWEAIKK